MERMAVRKRTGGDQSGRNKYLQPGGPILAEQELCRLEGFHCEYPLQRCSQESQCYLPLTTVCSAYLRLSEEERATLRAIGVREAKMEAELRKQAQRHSHWEEKAVAKEQVGQQPEALYLHSGVTFAKYQDAYVWGVHWQQVVSKKMSPTVAWLRRQ
jgi:hypothetical protein